MSYELPCGCIFASLDTCAIAWLGTFDFASFVEVSNNREKVNFYIYFFGGLFQLLLWLTNYYLSVN